MRHDGRGVLVHGLFFIHQGVIVVEKPGSKGPKPAAWGWTLFAILGLIIVGFAVGFLLDRSGGLLKDVPVGWVRVFHIVLVLAVGGIVSRLLERRILAQWIDRLHPEHATSLKYVTRLLLYGAIVLSVLGALGVGLSSVVFGGAFVTVIIGLAGQQVFANIIGGIWLILFHPFHIGDTIGLVTWQYPVLMPSFPHEAMRPSYHGRVRDINLMYTVLENGDGYPQVIPNGILVQAFIENRSHNDQHRVRLRFDVAFDIDATKFIDVLQTQLRNHYDEQATVLVADIYPAAYSVVVMVITDQAEELTKNHILQESLRLMRSFRDQPEI